MKLPPQLIRAAPWPDAIRFDLSPIQLGLGGSPWHIAVASIALRKTRDDSATIASVFRSWPTPLHMESSDTELERVLQPLGLQRVRARSIQQLSRKWYLDTWDDLSDLSGVGDYVSDAVSLFCFGCRFLNSSDSVLRAYKPTGPAMHEAFGVYHVDGRPFSSCLEAYDAYRLALHMESSAEVPQPARIQPDGYR